MGSAGSEPVGMTRKRTGYSVTVCVRQDLSSGLVPTPHHGSGDAVMTS